MNKMKHYYKLLALLIIPPFLLLFYYGAWLFSPGSYAKAEVYRIDVSEEVLIDIIKDFKEENPSFDLKMKDKTQNEESFYLNDDKKGFWHSFYFYYPEKNQIIHTWTRKYTNSSTNFAFVGVNNGLVLGNWIDANKYFWWWKNMEVKNEFEEKILKRIKKKVGIHNETL